MSFGDEKDRTASDSVKQGEVGLPLHEKTRDTYHGLVLV